MSILDKLKEMFSGGSSEAGARPAAEPDAATAADDAHDHAGHDHAGHDHSHDHQPAAPPTDPAGMPTSEPQPAEPQAGEGENRLS